ncbi:hypothetical protein ACFYY8_25655 [Streptosporangium sp. NPDC001559]|uniref:hypothetical protein n=1 Tax=Streptosporangium sp. NPDC001559 TaxID=3366187 RepID=UPI0036E8C0F4
MSRIARFTVAFIAFVVLQAIDLLAHTATVILLGFVLSMVLPLPVAFLVSLVGVAVHHSIRIATRKPPAKEGT